MKESDGPAFETAEVYLGAMGREVLRHHAHVTQ